MRYHAERGNECYSQYVKGVASICGFDQRAPEGAPTSAYSLYRSCLRKYIAHISSC